MKKLLIISNFITATLLLIVLLKACENFPLKEKLTTENTCFPCPKEPQADILLPAGYVKSLLGNYRDNQWKWINPNIATPGSATVDSRSVWFDMEKLKSFIAQAEAYVDGDRECPGNHCDKNLGVRIYFGAYGDGAIPEDAPDYNRLHTLVMIPTFYDNTLQDNKDFDPRYMSVCGDPDYDTAQLKIIALLPSTQINMANHGSLNPPPPPYPSSVPSCTGASLMHLVDKLDGVPQAITGCPF